MHSNKIVSLQMWLSSVFVPVMGKYGQVQFVEIINNTCHITIIDRNGSTINATLILKLNQWQAQDCPYVVKDSYMDRLDKLSFQIADLFKNAALEVDEKANTITLTDSTKTAHKIRML